MIIPDIPRRGYRTIRLPITESDYFQFENDTAFARTEVDQLYHEHPELFPATFGEGYVFNGKTAPSVKLEYRLRRIRLKADRVTFTLAPAFIMPYMTARSADIEKPLFLRRFNVPYWGLTYIYGRNDMYWYRLEQSLGRFSIVGTTVKKPELLPQDLLADEKHTRRGSAKQYIAMTVAKECILGAAMAESASEDSLREAYGVFAHESKAVNPAYAPDSVNTDGQAATQNARKHLFPCITVILCFLHAFIKIRDRAAKVLADSFNQAADRVWNAYKATSKAAFSQQIRRLQEWTKKHVVDSPMKKHILDLCAKRDRFKKSYAHEQAHRTSNMVDRLMKFFDRACFDGMYFHGNLLSGQQRVRAWAILWNFCPSCPATIKKHAGKISPAERLNNRRYDDIWLVNLLLSASMNGTSGYQQKAL